MGWGIRQDAALCGGPVQDKPMRTHMHACRQPQQWRCQPQPQPPCGEAGRATRRLVRVEGLAGRQRQRQPLSIPDPCRVLGAAAPVCVPPPRTATMLHYIPQMNAPPPSASYHPPWAASPVWPCSCSCSCSPSCALRGQRPPAPPRPPTQPTHPRAPPLLCRRPSTSSTAPTPASLRCGR